MIQPRPHAEDSYRIKRVSQVDKCETRMYVRIPSLATSNMIYSRPPCLRMPVHSEKVVARGNRESNETPSGEKTERNENGYETAADNRRYIFHTREIHLTVIYYH